MNRGSAPPRMTIPLMLSIVGVALFGALLVAQDIPAKLWLGGMALLWLIGTMREARHEHGSEALRELVEEQPAGPSLVGLAVGSVVFAVTMSSLLPSAGDGLLRLLIYAACSTGAYIAGQATKAAVLRLPRYQLRGPSH